MTGLLQNRVLVCVRLLLPVLALLSGLGAAPLVEAATPAQRWTAQTVAPRVGKLLPASGDEEFRFQLNDAGVGVLELPSAGLPLDQLNYFRLVLRPGGDAVDAVAVDLVWWLRVGEEIASEQLLPADGVERAAELAMRSDWPDGLPAIALRFLGTADAVVPVELVELGHREGGFALWRAMRSAWDFSPWSRSSINAYFLPASWWRGAMAISWIGAATMLAALAGCFPGRRRRTELTSILFVLCFLPGWLAFDLAWLHQLKGRASDAIERFADKDEAGALLASSDRELVRRARQVAGFLDEGGRVFVASRDDYRGMRQAYYLYPHNVYWVRSGPGLPAPGSLRAGDVIMLLSPTSFSLREAEGRLYWPGGEGSVAVSVAWGDRISRLLIVEGAAS